MSNSIAIDTIDTNITIDSINAARERLAALAWSAGRTGGFGGTGACAHMRAATLPAIIEHVGVIRAEMRAAWTAVHSMAKTMPRAQPVTVSYWAVERDGKQRMCASRRGARWAASTHGGQAVCVTVVDQAKTSSAIAASEVRPRALVAYAVALGDHYRDLERMGLVTDSRSTICAAEAGAGLTGIEWWLGSHTDTGRLSRAEVAAWVAGALSSDDLIGYISEA
jgi:hypothetical protein